MVRTTLSKTSPLDNPIARCTRYHLRVTTNLLKGIISWKKRLASFFHSRKLLCFHGLDSFFNADTFFPCGGFFPYDPRKKRFFTGMK